MRDAARKPWETAVPVAQATRRRASESLDDAPHRPRLPCYPPVGPSDRLPDLYGSLSALLGMTASFEKLIVDAEMLRSERTANAVGRIAAAS